jgi:hypothetical protein
MSIYYMHRVICTCIKKNCVTAKISCIYVYNLKAEAREAFKQVSDIKEQFDRLVEAVKVKLENKQPKQATN